MSRVSVEFSKWDGARHWHFEVEELGTDRHGSWFGGRPGIAAQRGDEDPVVLPHGIVLLVPVEGDWIANWSNREDRVVYVDVTDTPVVTRATVRAVDLDLDVIGWPDGRVEIVDRDEFEFHRIAMAYPPDVVARAEATAATLEAMMREARAPFDGSGAAWLKKATEVWSS